MCGLIGWLSKNQNTPTIRVKNYIVDQYQDQIGRGTKGYGLIEIGEDGFTEVLRATTEAKILLDAYGSKAKHMLFHHRSPTSSENYLDQTHPMEVEHEELAYVWQIMHNGVINNADDLKKAHEALGYVYLTEYKAKYTNYSAQKFNDSESLAIELARYLEGKGKEGKMPVMNTKGGFAFIAAAMDKMSRIQKVYIGNNGYGGINLADNGQAYYFASEEKTGVEVPKDEIIVFNAKYIPSNNAGEGKILDGFEMVKEPIKIDYYIEPEEIKSPYQSNWGKEFRDHRSYGRSGKAPVGFGFHGQIPKATSTVKDDMEDEKGNVNFSSYGHIVSYVTRGKLGEVFQDTKSAVHEVIEQFNLVDFNNFIIAGTPEKAEEMYQKYVEGIGDWLDMDFALAETLEPIATKIPNNPTTTDVIESFKEMAKKRMGAIAKDYMPLFWLASYCECIIHLAYQFQADLAGKTAAKIDMADPDKTLDEQIDKDIEEVFPSHKDEDEYAAIVLANQNQKEPEELPTKEEYFKKKARTLAGLKGGSDNDSLWNHDGTVKETNTKAISIIKDGKVTEEGRKFMDKNPLPPQPVEAEYMSDAVADMDNEAGGMLSALGESSIESTAEEIYQEAEEVGETIRTAAEMAVVEQLRIVTNLAVEDGMVLKIPFHFNKIKDEMEKTRRRLESLAHIVKATQVRESQDEFYAGGRPYMNG